MSRPQLPVGRAERRVVLRHVHDQEVCSWVGFQFVENALLARLPRRSGVTHVPDTVSVAGRSHRQDGLRESPRSCGGAGAHDVPVCTATLRNARSDAIRSGSQRRQTTARHVSTASSSSVHARTKPSAADISKVATAGYPSSTPQVSNGRPNLFVNSRRREKASRPAAEAVVAQPATAATRSDADRSRRTEVEYLAKWVSPSTDVARRTRRSPGRATTKRYSPWPRRRSLR